MLQFYSPSVAGLLNRLKMLGATLMLLCLLLAGRAGAQTTVFSEDFEAAPAGTALLPALGWDIYTVTNGNSRWAIGDASCVINGTKSLYVARNTVANPCDYAPASTTNRIAFKSFSTANYNNLKLSFKWVCNGEKIGSTFYDYGKVCYSFDGTTWTNLPANYQGQTTTQNVIDLVLPAAMADQPTVYIGFRWINDFITKHIPGFVVDDIVITGDPIAPPAATPVITALSVPNACSGSTLTITGTDLGSATSVTIGGTSAAILSNTATSISVIVPGTTSGDVVVTTAGGASNALPLIVYQTPVATTTPTSVSICDGAATSIALSADVAGTTFTWTAAQLSGGAVTGFSDCSSACGNIISQSLSLAGATPGVVRYTVIPAAGGCVGAPTQIDIGVNPAPTGSATPAAQTICSGSATSIALNSPLTGATFTWTAAPLSGSTASGFADCSSGCAAMIAQTLSTTATSAEVVRYTITPAVGGCTGTPFTTDITINPTPVVTATPAATAICSGTTTAVTLNVTSGAALTWTAALLSGGAVNGFSDCTSGCAGTIAQTLNATDVTPGVVRYTITPALGSCTGTAVNADVTVYPNPPATATPAASTICSGTSTSIALSTGVTGATFSWPVPTVTGGTVTGAVAGSGNTISQLLTNNGSTPATVTYTVTPANPGGSGSCTGTPVTVSVVVTPGVQITTQPVGGSQCGGDFTFSVAADFATGYQWYGPAGAIPGATASTYIIGSATAANSGDYYVVVSGAAGCPEVTSATATLTLSDPVIITEQPVSVAVCQSMPLTLSVASTGATSYQWYRNGYILAGATAATYTVASPGAIDAGTYYVNLTPASPCPSVASNTVTVTITPAGSWYGISNDWNDAANWCGGIPTATTNVLLPPTGTVPFDAHIHNSMLGGANDISLENSTLTVDNGGTLQLFGNLNLSPSGTFTAPGGTLRLSGAAAQQLQPGFTTGTLMIEGGGDKHLNKDVAVQSFLVLGSGNVVLNGHVLRLSPGANIFGISPASYIVTNGAGSSLQQVVGTAEYIFPVGVSSYNPVYMTNAGTPDTFKVSVREEVLENGSYGAPVDPAISTVILRTWDIAESVAGGSNGTITLQWNAGEENSAAFTYEHAYIAQYTSTGWVNTCCSDPDSAGVVMGAGPYSRTKTGITEFSHFTVASSAGEGPLLIGTPTGNGLSIQAFPNPVSDVLTVVINQANAQSRVSLTDMTGRELAAHFASSGRVTFDMRALAQGMYFVKYTDGIQSRIIKVSKQ